MKPIHLNLAARPYRDYRPVNLVASLTFVLTLVLAWYNVNTYLRYRTETSATRAKIAKLEAQTEDERRRGEAATNRAQAFDVKLLAAQTEFANSVLAERAFSWSELLDRLERLIPNDVRLESITPSFTKEGLVSLSIRCFAKNGEGMVSTLNNFNADPQFSNAFPSNEVAQPDRFDFSMTVDYRPSIARAVTR